MGINHVSESDFGASGTHSDTVQPHIELQELFANAFSTHLIGTVAFNQARDQLVADISDEDQWVAGMNQMIDMWNAMPNHSEKNIRITFNV